MKIHASSFQRIIPAVLTISVLPFAADTLPDAISDAEFWQMVQSMSEPNGDYPVAENFISNEIRFQRVIPALTSAVKDGRIKSYRDLFVRP